MNENLKKSERTEEIQAIVNRMPTNFGLWITYLILFLVISIVTLGWVISYPDVVIGQVVINASTSPIKLIANTSGKISLNVTNSQMDVKEGDFIAYIKNAADINDIKKVNQVIQKFNVTNINNLYLPKDVSLGELNSKYFLFLTSCEKFINFNGDNILLQQELILKKLIVEQKEMLKVYSQKLKMDSEKVKLVDKFNKRDSILFSKRVITEAEFDKSQINSISINDAHKSMINDITLIKNQLHETTNKLQQTLIEKNDKAKQLYIDLIASYTDLADSFKAWEQKYVFKAPIGGKVQFLKFWSNDQFLQAGEAVFTIVPLRNKIIGQMALPVYGAGKVKIGQKVIIKLENYPYTEYGSVIGNISSIALTTNYLKTDKGDIETYSVNVELPKQLKTNYGSNLDFKYEIKGTGEIITKDRRLIERLFDNLKYAIKK